MQRCRQCNGSNTLSNCETVGSDGAGVSNADYIAYITSITNGCSGSTLAYAGVCQREDDFDRYIYIVCCI